MELIGIMQGPFLVELGENTTTERVKYYPTRSSAVAGFGFVPRDLLLFVRAHVPEHVLRRQLKSVNVDEVTFSTSYRREF
jgi:hypothetical protein